MSARVSYPSAWRMTSGAIQNGVPTSEMRFERRFDSSPGVRRKLIIYYQDSQIYYLLSGFADLYLIVWVIRGFLLVLWDFFILGFADLWDFNYYWDSQMFI
jgi:hypothetical protein